ncbi:MAG TPA: EAL domain-containing protein, partial [Allosphingosinicella sp.]|nr:EAL domain-containing protein [Allosphingosinicella sp.]
GLESSLPRRIIVDGVARMCRQLGITLIAEGVETVAELEALRAIGIRYLQGYLFARPGFEHLPNADLSPLRVETRLAG